MASEHYREFIKEAFVGPIRSVLIVDDDYPTFDEVLGAQHDLNNGGRINTEKTWHGNPERIRNVIQNFRENDPPLLVDIHDGMNVATEVEKTVASHLHQSDLLVLDYQLDKSKPGDGTRSIEILRNLMSNDHFNLVIVYTKADLDTVFDAVRWGLIGPSSNPLFEEQVKTAEGLLENAEETLSGFSDRIRESIGSEQYLHSRLHTSSYRRTMGQGKQPYSAFYDECAKVELTPDQRKLVLAYVLGQVEKLHLGAMNTESSRDDLRWSAKSIKWIRGESIFICFSNKSDGYDLLGELQTALNDWNPNPSRLFLARLRAAMDEYGVVAQAQALTNKYALAYWYDRLLRAGESERRWHVAESVSRHSDRLMEVILRRVEKFATRLVEAEVAGGNIEQRCQDHFNVDLTKEENKTKAAREHNAFVCSMNPGGRHLTTGHVFLMSDAYWLCLSPACDMVPLRPSSWRAKMFGKRLPFIAVRLHQYKKWPEDIHSNRYLFLQFDGDIEVYCFNDPSRDNSVPHWNTLYAENSGEFSGKDFQFSVWRNEGGKDEDLGAEEGETRLVLKCHQARVVSQLRYEYALNLTQKLGVSLTRIGLDFSDGKA